MSKAALLYRSIFILGVALVLFSIWRLGSYYGDMHANERSIEAAKGLYEEGNRDSNVNAGSDQEERTPVEREPATPFEALLNLNSDTIGWLSIPGTSVDYPVVQTTDNNYYLDRGFTKSVNANGSIFMDYRSRYAQLDNHLIVYGHNMKNGTMFADLRHYLDADFLKEHPILQFDTLAFEAQWEVFSVYVADAVDEYLQTDFDSQAEYFEFMRAMQVRSRVATNVVLAEEDVMLTLSTCSSSDRDQRTVIHARRIVQEREA